MQTTIVIQLLQSIFTCLKKNNAKINQFKRGANFTLHIRLEVGGGRQHSR